MRSVLVRAGAFGAGEGQVLWVQDRSGAFGAHKGPLLSVQDGLGAESVKCLRCGKIQGTRRHLDLLGTGLV